MSDVIAKWCRSYALPGSGSFTLKAYGEAAATKMAAEWCRRMQWWRDLAIASGDGRYEFTAADYGSYVESEEFSAWVDTLDPAGKTYKRILEMRAQYPLG